MRFSGTVILLLALSLATILEGAFYDKSQIDIPQKIVSARFARVTRIACILQCRNNASCHQAAMQGSNCLLLKSGGESDDDKEKMETVTMFTETKVKRLVGKTYNTFRF